MVSLIRCQLGCCAVCIVSLLSSVLVVVQAQVSYPLALRISANKHGYVSGEPVFVEITLSHDGKGPEVEMMQPILRVDHGQLRIFVQPPGGGRALFHRGIHADGRARTRAFRQGDRISTTEVLTYNASARSFALESPGVYVIQADYPALGLVSNEVAIEVREPEAPLLPYAEAFKSLELVRFLDFDNVSSDLRAELLQPALAFVGDNPQNIYQYYVAAYVGCSDARSQDPERVARSIAYLRAVVERAGNGFEPRRFALLDLAQAYAATGSYRKALECATSLRAEFSGSAIAERIKDEELEFLRGKAAESGE